MQTTIQNQKKFCPSFLISQEPYITWLSFMVHMGKVISGFFIFFKILIFQVVRDIKRQKKIQNNKKVCLLHSISQQTYIIWLSSMVHICKMIISLGVFFIFSKFWFSASVGGVKGQKMVQNDKKLCLSHSISQELSIIWLSFVLQMCKMIKSPHVFFQC